MLPSIDLYINPLYGSWSSNVIGPYIVDKLFWFILISSLEKEKYFWGASAIWPFMWAEWKFFSYFSPERAIRSLADQKSLEIHQNFTKFGYVLLLNFYLLLYLCNLGGIIFWENTKSKPYLSLNGYLHTFIFENTKYILSLALETTLHLHIIYPCVCIYKKIVSFSPKCPYANSKFWWPPKRLKTN